jgi:hypothetical protein
MTMEDAEDEVPDEQAETQSYSKHQAHHQNQMCPNDTTKMKVSFIVMLHAHNTKSDRDHGLDLYNTELHQLFFCSVGGKLAIILSVYIDDLLIVGTQDNINTVKKKLSAHFHIKDFSSISSILSIDVTYDNTTSTLNICQKQKIVDLANKFDLAGVKPLLCLLPARTNLSVIKRTSHRHSDLKYCRLVGALLYIALAIHPDVLHTIIYLSCFICAYNNMHFKAAHHILQYLHSTKQQTIQYSHANQVTHKISGSIPVIHCDVSYGTNPLTTKSYSGNITIWAGGPITWWAQLQKTVTLSTVEAELVAITDATWQALYL